eukprot:TRINITY_DN983_c0_g1_i2.p1 TRINITY_DN983_c0_g1~~TRINITY_DN983_c0_g1_i2.p1  ORF type:complete len:530 (-),score=46.61 TRINITY_DN983_c0_g1_i2:38-1627(-)
MEVKGIGQTVPTPLQAEQPQNYKFEEVFDESRKKFTQLEQHAKREPETGNDPLIEISTLQSPSVDNNPLFISLKTWLANYKKELHDKSGAEKELGHHLKQTLYTCLLKLLHQIVLTKDRGMQTSYLQRVHDWFVRRNRNKDKFMPKVVKPRVEIVTPQQNNQLYQQKMRTYYPELKPPEERLENFQHKSIKIPTLEPISPSKGSKTFRAKERYEPVGNTPIGLKSNFLYYKPFETQNEQVMERIWLEKKNRALADKRMGEELLAHLNQWGNAKARVNENLVRKHENTRYATNFAVRSQTKSNERSKKRKDEIYYKKVFEELSSSDSEDNTKVKKKKPLKYPQIVDLRKESTIPQTKSLVPNPQLAFQNIAKQKVDYIRKTYGHLINAHNDKMEGLLVSPRILTVSVYNNPRHKLARSQSTLARAPITHSGTRDQFRLQQFREIETLRRHLAKEEIPCRVKSLERAILMPEDYPASAMIAENFIRPGSRLFINPFATIKIAKKGKKRKRKQLLLYFIAKAFLTHSYKYQS